MIFGVYSIRDVRTGFLSPTIEVNDQVAMRNFSHAVQRSDSLLHSFPGEYDIYKIGTFDSESGQLVPIMPQEFLCSASSILTVSKE